MKIAFFDTKDYDREFFDKANEKFNHEITYFEPRLTAQTALLAKEYPCVCCFVNDELDAATLCVLSCRNFKLIALRSAGYNNVDLQEVERLGMTVVRVPAYSPHAVAEHAVALLQSLNRKIHRAYSRVKDFNFSISGFVGFDLFEKTLGIIGTGKIGAITARILSQGYGCRVLAFDLHPDKTLVEEGVARYVDLETIYRESDVISLHVPLTPETHHFINEKALSRMKPGVLLINTGRGALIETKALIERLKSGHIGGAALDVYEEEEGVFFEDLSNEIIQDDTLARLVSFPNVLVTSHQGFFTREALGRIAETTLSNVTDFEEGKSLVNQVRPDRELFSASKRKAS